MCESENMERLAGWWWSMKERKFLLLILQHAVINNFNWLTFLWDCEWVLGEWQYFGKISHFMMMQKLMKLNLKENSHSFIEIHTNKFFIAKISRRKKNQQNSNNKIWLSHWKATFNRIFHTFHKYSSIYFISHI